MKYVTNVEACSQLSCDEDHLRNISQFKMFQNSSFEDNKISQDDIEKCLEKRKRMSEGMDRLAALRDEYGELDF